MNPNLLVGVWVQGDGWVKEEFATGYPVAPNRILTVGHLFKRGWNNILVHAVYKEHGATEATLVWPQPVLIWSQEDADRTLDAALLEWPFPPDFAVEHLYFVNEAPGQAMEWFSNCFPCFCP